MYAAKYFDAWAMRSGDRREIAAMKGETFTPYLRHLREMVPLGPILDVGTATGFFLHTARCFGFEPYGIEVSDYAAQIAMAKFGAERIHHGTIETCSFPNGTFTAITMFDLLEHVIDPLGTLRKAHDLLQRGGVIAIVTPDTSSLTRQLMGSSWPHYKLEHLSYWNPSTLRFAASEAGFSVEGIRPAVKTVTPRYMRAQLAVYPNALLKPMAALLAHWDRTADMKFAITMGEMTAYLRKSAR
jgi:SAM-dependent methyltransferase